MSDSADPASRDPDYDWRTEVNWPHVRRLMVLHAIYWGFGVAQVVLYWAGLLTGGVRTLIGIIDYLVWAALLVLSFGVVARTRTGPDSAGNVSGPTFLILFAFVASLCAYIVLLSVIGLDTIEL